MAAARPLMIPPAHSRSFLDAHGWADGTILPLAGDASFRRYFRVVAPGRTAVLMDAPPLHEDVRPFLAVADELLARGLSAPRTLAKDVAGGLLLIEDFGDAVLGPRLIAGAVDERAVYARAIDVLLHLAERGAPETLAAYDEAVLLREAMLFVDWYAPAVGVEVDAAGFAAAWRAAWGEVAQATDALVLRDYHVDNLVLLDRPGVNGLGLLDFQDALAGHPAYDLVSLLQDARRDVPQAIEAAEFTRFVAATDAEATQFAADYAVLGAQRATKVLGIFTRLWKRDGKDAYLQHQPRIWGYLERNLAHPALAPVADWFAANIPEQKRGAAWR